MPMVYYRISPGDTQNALILRYSAADAREPGDGAIGITDLGFGT
jgi:hypothetical protein